jgi:hypothetical protein
MSGRLHRYELADGQDLDHRSPLKEPVSKPAKAPSWTETEWQRKILAFAFCIDAGGVVDIGLRATLARPERVAELTGFLGLLAQYPLLRVALGLFAIGAAVRFSWKPGRVGSAFAALGATCLNYLFTAEFTGSVPNVLVCTGMCLFAWMTTFVMARFLWPKKDRSEDFLAQVERLAGIAALAAFAVYFFTAGLHKYLNSGWDWTDGSKIRALMLMYTYPPDSFIGGVQEAVLHSASLSRTLATITLLAQMGALVFPFTRKGRALVGSLLLGFEISVYFLTGIFAPGNMLLILGFSYPWHRLGSSGRKADDNARPLALPNPGPGRVPKLGVGLATLVTVVSFLPITPMTLGTPVTHWSRDRRNEPAPQQPAPEPSTEPRAQEPPPAPPIKPSKVEYIYVLAPAQQSQIPTLLKDIGFNKPLAGGYRFNDIKIEPTRVTIRLNSKKGKNKQTAVARIILEHGSKAKPGETRSKSFVIRSHIQTKDSQVKDLVQAATRSIVKNDIGGHYVRMEAPPDSSPSPKRP